MSDNKPANTPDNTPENTSDNKPANTGNKSSNNNSNTGKKMIRTVNALTSCFNKKLEISKNIYFFIVLFILYLIVFYSFNKIDKIEDCTANVPINQTQYVQLITGYVYWIISFILLVVLKFNGINIINNLVWKLDNNNTPTELSKNAIVKYFTNIATVIISVMNISVIAVMIITLFKIIKKTVEFISCKHTECTASDTCVMQQGKSLLNVRYLDGDNCLDRDGNIIGNKSGNDPESTTNLQKKLQKPAWIFINTMIFILILLFYIYTGYSLKNIKIIYIFGIFTFLALVLAYSIFITDIFENNGERNEFTEGIGPDWAYIIVTIVSTIAGYIVYNKSKNN